MSKESDKIQSVIDRSGHELHFDVVRFLRGLGWKVLVSPYYSDAQTGRSREIDIIAIREDEFVDGRALFTTKLFIECKYIKDPTVFWFDDVDRDLRIELVTRITPFDEREVRANGAQHHYLGSTKVAKLFSSSDKSLENEPFFGAVNQVLHGMLYSQHQRDSKNHYEHRSSTVYPLIVCKNFRNCLVRDSEVADGFRQVDSPFLFEANYAYLDSSSSQQNKYFLIDVVDRDLFSSFLEEIESDIGNAKDKIAFEIRKH